MAMAGGLAFGAFLLEPTLNALRGLDPGAAMQQLFLQPPQDAGFGHRWLWGSY